MKFTTLTRRAMIAAAATANVRIPWPRVVAAPITAAAVIDPVGDVSASSAKARSRAD